MKNKMKMVMVFCLGISLPLLLIYVVDGNYFGFSSSSTQLGMAPSLSNHPTVVPQLVQTNPAKGLQLSGLIIEPLAGLMRSPLWEAGLTPNVEDRSYIKLLPTIVNVPKVWEGKRKVYYDLGLNTFESSLGWMIHNYPVTFDAIYGWEVDPAVFHLPDAASLAGTFGGNEIAAQQYLDTIHYEYKAVGVSDSPTTRDIASFVKATSSPEDYVVLKMDVEGAEWTILPHFIEHNVIDYLDELFVEIHFADPQMAPFGWNIFAPHTLEEARGWMQRYRELGVFAHYWP